MEKSIKSLTFFTCLTTIIPITQAMHSECFEKATELQNAIQTDDVGKVERLLASGANPNYSVARMMQEKMNEQLTRQLIRKGNALHKTDSTTETSFTSTDDECIGEKVEHVLNQILRINKLEMHTALHHATNRRSASTPDIVHLLLKHGANVNAHDQNEDTPLHLATKAIYTHSAAIIHLLLKAGANINCRNTYGNKPIHCLLGWSKHTGEIANELINAGADIYERAKNGNGKRFIDTVEDDDTAHKIRALSQSHALQQARMCYATQLIARYTLDNGKLRVLGPYAPLGKNVKRARFTSRSDSKPELLPATVWHRVIEFCIGSDHAEKIWLEEDAKFISCTPWVNHVNRDTWQMEEMDRWLERGGIKKLQKRRKLSDTIEPVADMEEISRDTLEQQRDQELEKMSKNAQQQKRLAIEKEISRQMRKD